MKHIRDVITGETIIVHTAEDEDPECSRCEHGTDAYVYCSEHCGHDHEWAGYERFEHWKKY